MRRIVVVSLSVSLLVSAVLFGGLKLAGEVIAQPPRANFDDGWQVSTFTSIKFEDDVWDLVEEDGVCNVYRSEPKDKDHPATVMFSQLELVTTRSYPNFGATVKVCEKTVYLPATGMGSRLSSQDDD